MRRWHWLILTLVAVGVVGIVFQKQGMRSTAPGTVDDQIAIYRAIRQAEPLYGDMTRMYEATALPWHPNPSCAPPALSDDFPGMDPSLLDQWCATNHVPYPQNPLVVAELGLTSTSKQSGSLVSSAIQFDATSTQALVAVFALGGEFGMGTYFWLTKEQGTWHIAGSTLAFIT